MSPELVIFALADLDHNQQILVGLDALRRQGLVRLRYRYDGRQEFAVAPKSEFAALLHIVVVRIAGVGDIVFDTHDGPSVQEAYHAGCVAYFKRSYDPVEHGALPKVHPLGLNYEVRLDRPSVAGAVRAVRLSGTGKLKLRRALRALHLPGPHVSTAAELQSGAKDGEKLPPRILFVARTWEPDGFAGIPPHEVARRHEINAMRADCVRELRARFGDRFTGGLIRSPHAKQHFADCLVPADLPSDRRTFLELVATHPICIATAGLLDSTGWKMAEYVAKGRAVVSERMRYALPGAFQSGTHYLQFDSPAECVAHCALLLEDDAARTRMMAANRVYFARWGTPEAVMRNALVSVLPELAMKATAA